ncbi:MAG: hypothetical protein ABIQ85_04790 [Cypionkella sp.]|jgi:hypothetical protein
MIPDSSDPRWRRVLTTQGDLSSASLASRILIARLRRDVAAAPGSLTDKIAELRGFYAKTAFAQADIAGF